MKPSKAQQASGRMKWAGYRWMWKLLICRYGWLGPCGSEIKFPQLKQYNPF